MFYYIIPDLFFSKEFLLTFSSAYKLRMFFFRKAPVFFPDQFLTENPRGINLGMLFTKFLEFLRLLPLFIGLENKYYDNVLL